MQTVLLKTSGLIYANPKRFVVTLLTDKQREFISKFTWRVDFNFRSGLTELTIRQTQIPDQDWSRMLFLFPEARLISL